MLSSRQTFWDGGIIAKKSGEARLREHSPSDYQTLRRVDQKSNVAESVNLRGS